LAEQASWPPGSPAPDVLAQLVAVKQEARAVVMVGQPPGAYERVDTALGAGKEFSGPRYIEEATRLPVLAIGEQFRSSPGDALKQFLADLDGHWFHVQSR
jgi:hypothetical protein